MSKNAKLVWGLLIGIIVVCLFVLVIVSIVKKSNNATVEKTQGQVIKEDVEKRNKEIKGSLKKEIKEELEKETKKETKETVKEEERGDFKVEVEEKEKSNEFSKENENEYYRNVYIESCLDGGKSSRAYCECTFDYMVNKVGIDKVFEIASRISTGELSQESLAMLTEAVVGCKLIHKK